MGVSIVNSFANLVMMTVPLNAVAGAGGYAIARVAGCDSTKTVITTCMVAANAYLFYQFSGVFFGTIFMQPEANVFSRLIGWSCILGTTSGYAFGSFVASGCISPFIEYIGDSISGGENLRNR